MFDYKKQNENQILEIKESIWGSFLKLVFKSCFQNNEEKQLFRIFLKTRVFDNMFLKKNFKTKNKTLVQIK